MTRVLPLLLLGCAATEEDPCPNDLTYDNFGEGIIDQYCAGCHSTNIPTSQRNGAPPTVNLDHYAGIIEWVDLIEAEAATVDEPTMPPGGGTTAAERALIAEWLTCAVYPDAERLENAE